MDPNAEVFQQQWAEAIRLHQSGHIQAAARIYQALLQQFPGHPHLLHQYGLAQQALGDLRGAMHLLSQAVVREPDQRAFRLDLGLVLKQMGHSRAALERLQEVQQQQPDDAEIHFHVGDTCMDLGEAAAALGPFRTAIRLRPAFLEAWINLGLCLKACGQLDEALRCFQQVVQDYPDSIAGHVNLGLTHLLMGHYTLGWQAYEWRLLATGREACWVVPDFLLGPQAPPRWTGSALAGKTILILAEQGFGDTLQFVRYVPLLMAAGARVWCIGPPSLLPLLRTVPAMDRIGTAQDFSLAEPADCYCPLLSLPLFLHTQADTIPAEVPYVQAAPDRVRFWADRLGVGKKWRVGLVWRGKPLHQNDPLRHRSCTLPDLAPLARLADVTWVSLQKEVEGDGPLQPPDGMAVLDLRGALSDFAETAAIVSALDLVISIDTSVAHLAGALGKPVWILLPLAPDWRWSLHQETTPWYPTARLFRQTVPNCWQDPIQRMVTALSQWLPTHEDPR